MSFPDCSWCGNACFHTIWGHCNSPVFAGQASLLHPLFSLHGHHDPLAAMAMLPIPGQLLSSDHGGLLIFWDYVTQTAVRRFQHNSPLLCLSPRADREEILVGTSVGNILRVPMQHTAPVRDLVAAHAAVCRCCCRCLA
jgi:hypothetical protein